MTNIPVLFNFLRARSGLPVLVMLLCSQSVFGGLTVKAPDIAENGAVVPVAIKLDSPLVSGDKLTINTPSRQGVAVFEVTGRTGLTLASTRVRMMATGYVEAVVHRRDGSVEQERKNVEVTIGARIPDTGSSAIKERIRARRNNIKMLISNKMARDGYIRNLEVTVDNGTIKGALSPYLSQNPYFGFTGSFSADRAQVAFNTGPGAPGKTRVVSNPPASRFYKAANTRPSTPVTPAQTPAVVSTPQAETDPEILKLQARLREAKEKKQREERIAALKAELEKMEGASSSGAFEDDLPALINGAPAAKTNPRNYLFVVGIDDYYETAPVPFAGRSAKLFADAAQRRFGVPKENMEIMTGSEATGTRIKGRLKIMLGRLEQGDTLYFYYAGHGVPSRKGGQAFILPADGGVGSYEDPSFELNRLLSQMGKSPAAKVVAFIDACFSGQVDPRKMVFEGVAPAGRTRGAPLNKTRISKNQMAVFTAGKDDQFANQYKKAGHRLYSYYLIRGLLEQKGSLGNLHQYVSKNVLRTSRIKGPTYTQEPQAYGNIKMSF